jgi:hypothetical protein
VLDGFESGGGLFGGALDALSVECHALEAGVFVAPGQACAVIESRSL